MSRSIKIKIKTDNSTLESNNNKLKLRISSKENNGLSIVDGKLVGTKAPDGEGGSGGTMNTPGNALGPTSATESTSLSKIGCNSTVSRHQKYDGFDRFVMDNDGPVMSVVEDRTLVPEISVASFMIYKKRGEWIG